MDDDLKSASAALSDTQARAAYAPKPGKKRSGKIMKWLLLAVIGLVVVAGIGFAVWKFVLNKPKTTPVATAPAVTQPKKVVNDIADEPLSKDYSSTALSVAFKYPEGWKASEASGGIRIESPNFTYQDATNTDVSGNFRIYIRQGARTIDGKYIGRGVAIKPSEKLTYTQPAIGQRTDTLLSSFGLDTSDNFAFFMIAGNFQLQKEDTLGPDYGKEAETYIVAGGYSTSAAIDDLATTPVSINYYATTNAYKQAHAIIASLKLQ